MMTDLNRRIDEAIHLLTAIKNAANHSIVAFSGASITVDLLKDIKLRLTWLELCIQGLPPELLSRCVEEQQAYIDDWQTERMSQVMEEMRTRELEAELWEKENG